jgi:small-conductance mechanosensitive channel
MENVLRPVIVFGGAIVLAFVIALTVDRLMRRADEQRPDTPLWGLLRRGRVPFQAVVFVALLNGFFGETHLNSVYTSTISLWLRIVLIAAAAWLALRVLAAVVETTTTRYAGVAHDPARARRVKTQLTLIQRLVTAVVVVIAGSTILLQFPAMRTLGTSMLASAGVLGIVAGIAAQSTLGNLFAGLSIAFGDMVRIGDEVVVDGQLGTVDEITVSYLVLRTWDERRITMPVSYFTSKPFENWSRGGPQLAGTVFLQLDHSAPIALIRAKTEELVRANDLWDGRSWSLMVTDATPSTIEVRAVVSARTSSDLWTLRCELRELLLDWLQREHPEALPGIRLSTQNESPPAVSNGHKERHGESRRP